MTIDKKETNSKQETLELNDENLENVSGGRIIYVGPEEKDNKDNSGSSNR